MIRIERSAGFAWSREPADLLTPVGAWLRLGEGHPPGFLLESVEGGAARGRYSVIGIAPDLVWRCRHGTAEIARAGDGFHAETIPPLDSLRALVAEARLDLPDALPPMAGGIVGYLGYDMVRQMERLPDRTRDALGLPEAMLVRPTLFAIFDTVRDELILAAPVRAGTTHDQAAARIEAAHGALARPLPPLPPPPSLPAPAEPASNIERAHFLRIVSQLKDYIAAGDAFQIVASQRFSQPFPLPPIALYRALRRINPAPFLFHLDYGDFAVVGSSPEILVRLRDGKLTLRPLAGTRPRGATREADQALEADLLADPKERAEHLMLLDLGRNDLGRVAEPGSVRVAASFEIERFSHVMHLSSTVEARLRPGLSAIDALVAGFPAGTLTGAPKIRAMEIIEEQEPDRRGIYAGCIGYFAANGEMDTCIGLRMAVLKQGTMHVQAGCGVVADSNPETEWEETRHKARAVFRAAELALNGAG
jgi:anthranilate synthase component I